MSATINKGRKSRRQIGDASPLTSIYIGYVRDTADPQKMGRLSVWIPDLGPDQPDTYITVSYASPFAGVTNIADEIVDDRTEQGSQRSYGIWAVPPDNDNQVLVCFVNGDPGRGFWFGCIYPQNMNHMVPGIGMNVSTDTEMNEAFAPYSPPVVEYNKKDTSVNPTQPVRPVRSALAEALLTQGLAHDPERGVSNTSARRESPSLAQGWLTPGGNSISFDDNPDNSFIRFRTKSGAQIMVSDTSGYIYMITKGGNSWIEMSDAAIEIYSSAAISVRSEDDINLIADGDLNLDAGQDVNIHAGGKIRSYAGGNIESYAADDMRLQAAGKTSIRGKTVAVAGGTIGLSSSGSIVSKATGMNARIGAPVMDNAGGAPASADSASYKEASSIGNSNGRASIASAMPAHEPYDHPINASVSLSYDDADASGGTTVITRADGSTVDASVSTDNSTVRKISGFKVSDKVNGCILAASRRTGVKYADLMAFAAQESSFNPNAGARGGGAKGLFQFMPGTWRQTYDRYGPNGSIVKNKNVINNYYDPCSSALLGAYYYKENIAMLANSGLGTGPTDVYFTHLLGPSGGKKFLKAVKTSPNSPNTVHNNPAIFVKGGGKRTNIEAYRYINAKIGATVPQWDAYQKSHRG